jgi:hypothetical protein
MVLEPGRTRRHCRCVDHQPCSWNTFVRPWNASAQSLSSSSLPTIFAIRAMSLALHRALVIVPVRVVPSNGVFQPLGRVPTLGRCWALRKRAKRSTPQCERAANKFRSMPQSLLHTATSETTNTGGHGGCFQPGDDGRAPQSQSRAFRDITPQVTIEITSTNFATAFNKARYVKQNQHSVLRRLQRAPLHRQQSTV